MANWATRLRKRLRDYWGRSIRRQLAWSFGLVSLLLMLLMSYLLFSHQRAFLYAADAERAGELAQALASSSTSWVLANDLAGLQEVLGSVSQVTDLELAVVLSPRGAVLASTRSEQVGKYMTDAVSRRLTQADAALQVLVDSPELLDLAYPIMAGAQHLGWVRVEMTRTQANRNLQALRMVGAAFSMLALAATILMAVWLSRRLTLRLYRLTGVAAAVEQGQRYRRAADSGRDELGQLARSVDRMLDALDASDAKLSQLNRLYAAWTECTDIIVRISDEQAMLDDICRVLAVRVPFGLVWVGVADSDGWVRPVACSHKDSTYLRGLRISTSGELGEGRGPTGTAIRERLNRIFNDFLGDPDTALWHAHAATHNFRSVAAFPLWRGEACWGAITVYSEEKHFFSDGLITLMNGLAEDISFALDNLDRELQRKAAVAKLEQAACVFENSAEGIIVTDADNNIISVNRSFTSITGYAAEEVVGRNPRMLASGRHGAEFYNRMWHDIRAEGSWRGEIWNRRSNGEVYPESLTITCVKNAAGQVTNYIAIFGDITERKQAEERIQQLAHYDALTGLPNRLLLNDRLQQAIAQARRNGSTLATLFLDLDRFKQINDTLGHDVGDQLLKIVAQRLSACVREQDTISRLGGDEFIAVLPGADARGAALVAEKMLQAVTQPCHVKGHDLRVSTSVGIALYPDHAEDVDDLIKYADVAMYQAKESGRGHTLLFNPGMNVSAYERLALETSLRAALEGGQFELYYQPQVDLHTGRIVGCEALMRWNHPQQGMIPPASFIPLAEETGLIGPISDWVLEEAIRQCRAWQTEGLPPITVAVNLSALQFRQRDLYAQISDLLAQYRLPPASLELELTESILMQGVERTLNTLHNLTGLGVGLSIDDFGTGYSSLSYLKRFPIQKLKIDQTFVRDCTMDSNDAVMVRTIILMAQSLNLHVVAEGVETESQATFLRNAGCERAQGYLFGRPVPAADFAAMLRAGTAMATDGNR